LAIFTMVSSPALSGASTSVDRTGRTSPRISTMSLKAPLVTMAIGRFGSTRRP
jgi:hypothetical protein